MRAAPKRVSGGLPCVRRMARSSRASIGTGRPRRREVAAAASWWSSSRGGASVVLQLHAVRQGFRIQHLDHHAAVALAIFIIPLLHLELRLAVALGDQVLVPQ